MKAKIMVLLVVLVMAMSVATTVNAGVVYQEPDTGYVVKP